MPVTVIWEEFNYSKVLEESYEFGFFQNLKHHIGRRDKFFVLRCTSDPMIDGIIFQNFHVLGSDITVTVTNPLYQKFNISQECVLTISRMSIFFLIFLVIYLLFYFYFS